MSIMKELLEWLKTKQYVTEKEIEKFLRKRGASPTTITTYIYNLQRRGILRLVEKKVIRKFEVKISSV